MKAIASCSGILLAVVSPCGLLHAQNGVLFVHVSDPQESPISGVVLSTESLGTTSPPTDDAGKTRIKLPPQTKPNDSVTLQMVRPRNLVFISPWDGRTRVPSFDNESENFVSVKLVGRGQKAALQDERVLVTLLKRLNDATPLTSSDMELSEREREENRREVAEEFGLDPSDIDQALREWGRETENPFEKGLAALYEERYAEASDFLSTSLEIREQKEERETAAALDKARFLGRALYQEGKYLDSATAFQKAVDRRNDDPLLLNALGLSLHKAGNYTQAEPVYQRALAIDEKAPGAEHPNTARDLNNLALLHRDQGRYSESEPLFQRSLTNGTRESKNLAHLFCANLPKRWTVRSTRFIVEEQRAG